MWSKIELPDTCPKCGNKWLGHGLGAFVPSCIDYASRHCKCGWTLTKDERGYEYDQVEYGVFKAKPKQLLTIET